MIFKTMFVCSIFLFASWSNVSAQNKVVVVPLGEKATEIPAPKHAQVDANGTLFLPSGVVSSSKTATGRYVVEFDEDIRSCIPAVTAFDLDRIMAAELISITEWGVDARSTANQTAADGGFFIILSCPLSSNTNSLKTSSSLKSSAPERLED